MIQRFKKMSLLSAAVAVVAVPMITAPAAFAAESDISVNYSTQNNANAPIDGSYTVHGRVDQTRDDMQVSYTIQNDSVQYPIPVLEYTGDFTQDSDATYSFRFDCDDTVPGSDCGAYQGQIDAMNAVATTLDGNSVQSFTADVTPIILAFGGNVPLGIRGTVNVSVNSSIPGTGQLQFFLQEGTQPGAERLSPTAVTPLSITQPEIAASSTRSFCVAGLTEYTEGDKKYTPTGAGRAAFDVQSSVTDAGILPDDATAVGVNLAGMLFSIESGGAGSAGLTEAQAEAALLSSGAGTYSLGATYTAPDGDLALPLESSVTVLGSDDASCWSVSTVSGPVDPTNPANPGKVPTQASIALADTGAEQHPGGLLVGGVVAAMGAGTIAFALMRRRALDQS